MWQTISRFVNSSAVLSSHREAESSARSESTEDHLERIHDLIQSKGYARVSDIAQSLNLSRSTVSNMVRRLAGRGFLNYERYRGFTLTEEGWAVARHIKERHQMLTELLQMLDLEKETIDAEVEDIEHHLTPATLRVLTSLVEFWRQNQGSLAEFLSFHQARVLRGHPAPGTSEFERQQIPFLGVPAEKP
jgi:Mn-dependent DtxR family transcriptional regulator